MNRIQLSNITNQIKQKVEEANMNMIFNLKEMGLSGEDNDLNAPPS